MKTVWFIVNPISGTQDKARIISRIPAFFPADRFDVTVKFTGYAGHASLIASQAAKAGADVVVAVGGDGTVNDTARALIHTSTALGIVPCGSGNGLARHLDLPMSPDGALEIISGCHVHALDYGLINGHPFFCTAGVGFDAFLSDKFNKSGKRGLLSYVENALREGVSYEPETYEIEILGEESEKLTYKAFLITCANASQYGNDFFIAPHASMSDGLMDVTIMQPFGVLESPQIAYQLVTRTIDQNSRIKTLRCKELVIRRQAKGAMHIDGDPYEADAEVRVSLVSKGINVVVNEGKQPWQPPLYRMFNEIYTGVTAPMQNTPDRLKKLIRLNEELLSNINNKLKNKLTP